MATAKEKREAQEREREERRLVEEAEALRLWPARLMGNLERATMLGLTIDVEHGQFAVTGRTNWDDNITFRFNHTPANKYWDSNYHEGDWDSMDALERHLSDLEEAKREAERVRLAKETALAKLTPEDRKVLGL